MQFQQSGTVYKQVGTEVSNKINSNNSATAELFPTQKNVNNLNKLKVS